MSMAFLAAALVVAAAPVDEVVVDRIVAVVNHSVVLQSELDTLLEQMMAMEPVATGKDPVKERTKRRELLLDTLIAEKLLDEEVRKLRVDVTEAEVDRVVTGTMQEHGLDDKKLEMALAQQGMTLLEYREGLKKQLTKMKIVQLKVKNRVQVSDQDVKGVYQQKVSIDADEFRVRARHILVAVAAGSDGAAEKNKVLAARARIAAGAAFEDVAQEVSDDAASKVHGGDLGVFGRGEMVPEFEREAWRAKVGEVVGPFRTQFGWHVLRVDEHVGVVAQAPEQALQSIRERLYATEVESQFNSYVEELKRQAHIERRL